MTVTEKEVLEKINGLLIRGDNLQIAQITGYAKEYISKALKISNDLYNQKIVDAAIEVTRAREKVALKSLQSLPTLEPINA